MLTTINEFKKILENVSRVTLKDQLFFRKKAKEISKEYNFSKEELSSLYDISNQIIDYVTNNNIVLTSQKFLDITIDILPPTEARLLQRNYRYFAYLEHYIFGKIDRKFLNVNI